MPRAIYGRTKKGHAIHFCSHTKDDGKLCGRRVETYGSRCWQHRKNHRRIKFQAPGYPDPLTGKVLGGSLSQGFQVEVQFAGGVGTRTFTVHAKDIVKERA